jgi:hypothetical protein
MTVRETPIMAINSRSRSRSPGFSRPEMMDWRNSSRTWRRRGAADLWMAERSEKEGDKGLDLVIFS